MNTTQIFFLLLAVALLCFGLRSFRHPVLRKSGAFCVLVFSYLVAYFLTGHWYIGVICALSWFFLPWLEIVSRIRKMRMPADRKLRLKNPPPAAREIVGELTDEVEQEKFEHASDAGWEWEESQQFFRLFYKDDERCQASICIIEQASIMFFYLSLSSRASDGSIWTTCNYPFSNMLKTVPQLRMNRQPGDQTFLQLLESHRLWLAKNHLSSGAMRTLASDEIQKLLQSEHRSQVAYNLDKGLLTAVDEGRIRYSWRGLFFLWIQFIRDFVRLS